VRTVRVRLADSPRVQCSSRVLRVLARFLFRSGFILGFCCSRFVDGPSFSSGRFGSGADGPPGPRGRLLTVKIRQPSHEFTFGVGMSFIPYPLVLTPVV
jgi:hypothetical protein